VSHASMDHIVSLIVFIAAFMIFIGLFGQSIQAAVAYQTHSALATKASDLLDNLLLNPGVSVTWGIDGSMPTGFGLQDPEFTQYQLSPFSLMRLQSPDAGMVEYDKTPGNVYYGSLNFGSGASLETPMSQDINYSRAAALLGINGTYAFQLTVTPDISVSVTQQNPISTSTPLSLQLSADGTGFPLAGATVNYCLLLVSLAQQESQYPAYTILSGSATTNQEGMATVSFPSVTNPNQIYAFVAYAHLNGVEGVGYLTSVSESDQYVEPIVTNMTAQQVALTHNYDLNSTGNQPPSMLKYNATFVISTQDYSLTPLSLGNPTNTGTVGTVTSGIGNTYPTINLPTYTTGILIVTYQEDGSNVGGVVMMPWGVSSLAFPITFGGNPAGQSWVATDIRQVTIANIAYQVKLSLWSQTGEVIS
jgi:hypothetical protein